MYAEHVSQTDHYIPKGTSLADMIPSMFFHAKLLGPSYVRNEFSAKLRVPDIGGKHRSLLPHLLPDSRDILVLQARVETSDDSYSVDKLCLYGSNGSLKTSSYHEVDIDDLGKSLQLFYQLNQRMGAPKVVFSLNDADLFEFQQAQDQSTVQFYLDSRSREDIREKIADSFGSDYLFCGYPKSKEISFTDFQPKIISTFDAFQRGGERPKVRVAYDKSDDDRAFFGVNLGSGSLNLFCHKKGISRAELSTLESIMSPLLSVALSGNTWILQSPVYG